MLIIQKLAEGIFDHINSDTGVNYFISDFYYDVDNGQFQVKEINGAHRPPVNASDVRVQIGDDGVIESFPTITALKLRLGQINYPKPVGGGGGGGVAYLDAGTGIVITGSGTEEDPYSINAAGLSFTTGYIIATSDGQTDFDLTNPNVQVISAVVNRSYDLILGTDFNMVEDIDTNTTHLIMESTADYIFRIGDILKFTTKGL